MKKEQQVSLLNGLWVKDWQYNIRFLLVFMAAEVLMAYSPFGYIILPTISLTTLFIGVLIAALWGGPLSGAAVGFVFGLTSMWKASVTAVNANDLIFSPVKSGNPWGSIILALGPRILFGIVAGLVYYIVMKWVPRKIRIPLVLVLSALLERVHSSLTYLFMDKVFHVQGASMAKSWKYLFSSNRIQTYIIVMVIVLCAYILYDKLLSKAYYEQYLQIKDNLSKVRPKYTILVLATILIILLTATHLWERIQIILFDIDQFQPEASNIELIFQVILQFVVAAISALYILFAIYRHARYVEENDRSKAIIQRDREKERAEEMKLDSMKDPLTGAFNRKGLEDIVMEDKLNYSPIIFLLVDIDQFKEINDNFGHDAGDLILTEVANCLVEAFGKRRVFRFGGDEFAALIETDRESTENNITEKWNYIISQLEKIHHHLSGMLEKNTAVTLSVGVCFSADGYTEKLYPLADSALYETKNNGRVGCTLMDQDCKVLARWKDTNVSLKPIYFEISNTGVCQIEYSLNEDIKPRLLCSEKTKNFLCIPKNTSPEECYEIWFHNISASDVDGYYAARKLLHETGMASYHYVWNHPLKGGIKVESGGTAKIINGVVTVLGYYQLIINSEEA